MKTPRSFTFLLFLLSLLWALAPLHAASFTVTNTDDAGLGSLRQAIIDANAAPGADSITFSDATDGTDFQTSQQVIVLTTGQLEADGDLTIKGPRAGLIVDGGGESRIFGILGGVVEISNLIVQNGNAGTGETTGLAGGGIWNNGQLTLTGVTIRDCQAGEGTDNEGDGSSGRGGDGGGVYSTAASSLVMVGCTLHRNRAGTGGSESGRGASGRGGDGGAVFNAGQLSLTNVTISHNGAGDGGVERDLGGSGRGGDGGGVFSRGPTTVIQCTVIANVAGSPGQVGGPVGNGPPGRQGNGGGFATDGTHPLVVTNSLIADNDAGEGPDVFATDTSTITSNDHNFIGSQLGTGNAFQADLSFVPGQTITDLVDPNLANNGGIISTYALPPYSPLLHAGANDGLPADTLDLDGDDEVAEQLPVDGRGPGFPRILLGTVDIGAVEATTDSSDTTSTHVTNTNDSGPGTLRQAILNANLTPEPNIITFSNGSTGTTDFHGSTQVIALERQIVVSDDLTINGPGGGLIVDGGGGNRIFGILGGVVEISNLIVQNGNAGTGETTGLAGGGIWNNGQLTLTGVTIRDCQAGEGTDNEGDGSSGRGGDGGGVYSTAASSLVMVGCTLHRNRAGTGGSESGEGASGRGGDGGAVFNAGQLSLTNVTISHNGAGDGGVKRDLGGSGRGGDGGGVFSRGPTTVIQCTVIANVAGSPGQVGGPVGNGPPGRQGNGGGFATDGTHPLVVTNSLIADNDAGEGPDVFATDTSTITSNDHNFIGSQLGTGNAFQADLSFVPGQTITDLVDPNLANNGGIISTYALPPYSPLLHAGANDGLPTDTLDLDGDDEVAEQLPVDGRGPGFPRILLGTVDIGAVEATTDSSDTTSTHVTNTNDSGPGTLRQAILNANLTPEPNIITFSNGSTGTTDFHGSTQVIALERQIVVSDDLTINGPGGGLTVDGGGNRIFGILGGVVEISNLIVQNGNAGTGETTGLAGGGIWNNGQLTLTGVTIRDCQAGEGTDNEGDGPSGRGGDGGGVYSTAASSLVMVGCTLHRNRAGTGGSESGRGASGRGGDGGAVFNAGQLSLTNVTISHNGAGDGGVERDLGGSGRGGDGGGVFSRGPTTVIQCTVIANVAGSPGQVGGPVGNGPPGRQGNGGGFATDGTHPLVVTNSLIADNDAGEGPDVFATDTSTITSNDHNFIGSQLGTGNAFQADLSLGIGQTLAAVLDPGLSDHGGPTETHALLVGSPAIDAGVDTGFTLPDFDQRGVGFPRVVGTAVDIGAYEATPPLVGITAAGTSVTEGGAGVDFTLTRDGTSGELDVKLMLASGGALSGEITLTVGGNPVTIDAGSMFTVAIPDGQNSVTLTLTAMDDNATNGAELAENVQLTLVADATYEIDTNNADATVEISANGTHVTNTNDAGEGSLRQAILNANAAAGADTITFATGVTGIIQLQSALPALNTDIVIDGPGADVLTVRRNTGGSYRIFDIAGASTTVEISGLTITNGEANPDGGNSSKDGGGISNRATLVIRDSSISDNSSSDWGGGIFNSGTLTIHNSSISGNSSSDWGGGIFNRGTLTIHNSSISGNSASSGGGIYNTVGTLAIHNSSISGNSASSGGGIYNTVGTLAIHNSSISGNSAQKRSSAGGIWNSRADLILRSCTFNGGNIGRGIFNDANGADATLTISNTILNRGAAGQTLTTRVFGSGQAIVISEGGNLSSDGASGLLDHATDKVNTDPMLGPLADNGGPTETHALLPGSPAIDAGVDTGFTLPDFDQRGTGFPRIVGAAVDIGAYEAPLPIVVTTLTDENDGTADPDQGDGTSLREAIASANAAPGPDTITFDAAVTGIIQLQSALPDLSTDIVIDGPGVDVLTVRRDSIGNYHIFNIAAGSTTVEINGLTISNGADSGLRNASTGAVSITNCVISGNAAGQSDGGGVFHDGAETGTLTLRGCLIDGNSGQFGGGVHIRSGEFTAINTTISGNEASRRGGGLFMLQDDLAHLLHATVTGNHASGRGGGISKNSVGTITLTHSIVAGNTVDKDFPEIQNDVDETGANLIGIPANLTIGDILSPLADNGGPTKTHALPQGSPAIDAGEDTGSLPDYDQRGTGFPRVVGAAVDIGAYEAPLPIVVTTLTDEDDGTAAPDQGDGTSLREAIVAANAAPGPDTITFDPAVTGIIQLQGALPALNTDIVIDGPGADVLTVRRDTGGNYRIFNVAGAITTTVRISGLTITNGRAQNGGAIRNGATLTIYECSLSGNSTADLSGFTINGGGGGILNFGRLTIHSSSILGNSNTNQGDGGGGILNFGPLTIHNSTISGNTAGIGGGIFNANEATVLNCTLSDNDGTGTLLGGIGGIFNDAKSRSATLTIGNTIFESGTAGANLVERERLDQDRFSTVISLGGNLSSDGASGLLIHATDQVNTDPMLGPLADNGGPTETHALLPGSPAIDAGVGTGFTLPDFDQRGVGFPRVVGTAVDIGAYEATPPLVGITAAGTSVTEGGAGVDLTLTRDGTSGELDVKLMLASGGALSGEITLTVGGNPVTIDAGSMFTVAIPDGQNSVTLTLTAMDDNATNGAELAENVQLTLVADATYEIDTNNADATVEISANGTHVTNTNDAGEGSLRQAILNANAAAGADTITFATGVTGFIQLQSELPALSTDIVIDGPGAEVLSVRRDTGGEYRIFDVAGGSTTVEISGLTITNGNASFGGGIRNGGTLTIKDSTISDNSARDSGGGISNDGTLTINHSTISSNSARDGGGGIRNGGMLTVNHSTISGNYCSGFESSGGGIVSSEIGGTLTVNHSTISRNAARDGGGIYSFRGDVTVLNSTLSSNSTSGSGITFAVFGANATLTIGNTILDHGSAGANLVTRSNGNSMAIVDSLGGNLSSDDASGLLDHATDKVNTDPMLGPLADNGGPTQTHALVLGSPAIDAGLDTGSLPATDQRGVGFPRVVGTAVDIGAYEAVCDTYIDAASDFLPAEPELGDTVTWKPGTDDAVSGLTFGVDAFSSVQAAIVAVCPGGTVHLAEGTYQEGRTIFINKSLTVMGDGADVTTLDGGGQLRVATISQGSYDVTLSHFEIANGESNFAGGLSNGSSGSLVLTAMAFTGNTASAGGALATQHGSVMVSDSLFTSNSANVGSAIRIGNPFSPSGDDDTEFRMINSTVSGNSGGTAIQASGTVNIIQSTITLNSNGATEGNNAISGEVTLANSIVAGNTGGNGIEVGAFTSVGENIVGTSGLALAEIINTTLADNGGPTHTHALASDSLAIDTGGLIGSLPDFDQRGVGFPRVVGAAVDIGAYESSASLVFSYSFDGPTVPDGTATLSYTITNPRPQPVMGLTFTHDLDAVLLGLVATGLPTEGFCGEGSEMSGTSLLTLTGATVPEESQCTFQVTVKVPIGAAPGSYPGVTSSLLADGMTVAMPATATLSVEPTPTFTASFAPNPTSIVDGASTLTFTIDNSASALAATEVSFTNSLPAGLEIATPANAVNDCGGSLTAADGTISLSGGTVAAGATCTISVDVVATAAGTFVNTSGELTSSSGNSGTASDTLSVNDTTPPVITLTGADTVFIECGLGSYSEQGATTDDGSEVVISGDVGTILGNTYQVHYDAMDAAGNAAARVTRMVTVVDTTAPVITLLGDASVEIQRNSPYNEPGATAEDACDQALPTVSISGAVDTTTIGTYTVTYKVTDASGNAADQVNRTVKVIDNQAPVITLTGSTEVTVECGQAYSELGATANDASDGDLTDNIVIDATAVDTTTPSNYQVTYNVTDSANNAATQVTRTVKVVDTTAPVITVTGENPITVLLGSTYADAGATAEDACDGTLEVTTDASAVDTSTIGTYKVTYTATDAAGNVGNNERTVNVQDNEAPVITLLGAATITIECGDSFNDPGASAEDTSDGDLTDDIVANGSVDITKLDTYTITYDVSDSTGNAAQQVTRTVNVVDTTAPVITLLGENPLVLESGDAYVEPGATAEDACDQALPAVSISGAVDTTTIGTYTVTYKVTDASGNAAEQVTRTVRITTKFEATGFDPIEVAVNASDTVLDLNTGFTSPSPLTFTIEANSNPGFLDLAEIDGSNLTIGYRLNLVGSVTLTIEATNEADQTLTADLQITVTGNAWQQWQNAEFDRNDLANVLKEDSLWGDDANPDGDCLNNVWEFLHGTDPEVFDLSPAMVQGIADNAQTLQFKRRVDISPFSLTVTFSSGLEQILAATTPPAVATAIDDTFDAVEYTDTVALTENGTRWAYVELNHHGKASSITLGSACLPVTPHTSASQGTLSFLGLEFIPPKTASGTVTSAGTNSLTDAFAQWPENGFATSYVIITSGEHAGVLTDIESNTSTTLTLMDDLSAFNLTGETYEIRPHQTIGRLFGESNASGLHEGQNAMEGDNVLLIAPGGAETQLFYSSLDGLWLDGNFAEAKDLTIAPSQGFIIRRKVDAPLSVYVQGSSTFAGGVTPSTPIENGYNLLSVPSNRTLDGLNLNTGDPATGLVSGLNPSQADNLLVINPDGSTSLYWLFENTGEWMDIRYQPAGSTLITSGTSFYILRRDGNVPFNWSFSFVASP